METSYFDILHMFISSFNDQHKEDNKLKIIFRTKGFRSKNNPIVFANLMVKDNDGVLVGFGEPYNPNVVSKDDIKERLCIRMVGYLGYIGVQRLVIIDCKQKLN